MGSKWNQAIKVLLRSRSRDQDQIWATNINPSTHFSRYSGGVARFLSFAKLSNQEPWKWSNQAIKDDFHWSKFLITFASTSTGDMWLPLDRGLGKQQRNHINAKAFLDTMITFIVYVHLALHVIQETGAFTKPGAPNWKGMNHQCPPPASQLSMPYG